MMIDFLRENLSTILIGFILITFDILAIRKLLYDRKRGSSCSSCGSYGSCSDCRCSPKDSRDDIE